MKLKCASKISEYKDFIILISFVSTIKDADRGLFSVTYSGIQHDNKMPPESETSTNDTEGLLAAAIVGGIEGIAIILLTIIVIVCCKRYKKELKGLNNTVRGDDDYYCNVQANQTCDHVYEGLQIATTVSEDPTHTPDFMDMCIDLRSICTICFKYRQELNGADNTVRGDDNDYCNVQAHQTCDPAYEGLQITTAVNEDPTHTPHFMDDNAYCNVQANKKCDNVYANYHRSQ